jgi:hypothetical protein
MMNFLRFIGFKKINTSLTPLKRGIRLVYSLRIPSLRRVREV